VVNHIEHIIDVAGIDHVGIGSDFYDKGGSSMVAGLEDCSKYPVLIAELLKRDFSDEDVRKIAGGNLLRAMREMERVAQP
jgi:membrane dipeptidase